jgi:aspartate dehydrogenase
LSSSSTAADTRKPLGVAILGYGAIGSQVAGAIAAGEAGCTELRAVLVQSERAARPAGLPTGCYFGTDAAAFFAAEWELCVEAAGQPAVRSYGARVLGGGNGGANGGGNDDSAMAARSLLLTSIGALTDDALRAQLESLSRAAPRHVQLLLCTGSLPAVDWLGAASLAPITTARITQSKPPAAWKGTPAEARLDLDGLLEPTVVFEGPAREAAALFPKNANVSAMFALTTAGLDATQVRLMAVPGAAGNKTQIEFEGEAGVAKIEVLGSPSPTNPKTSYAVPLSVVKALRNLTSEVFQGV